jgi:hypothetical protein
MKPIQDLVRDICRTGAILCPDPPDIRIVNASRVPRELKVELKERKPEFFAWCEEQRREDEARRSPERLAELSAKRRKLEESGITTIAILDDGTMRICRSRDDIREAVSAGAGLYSPEDCYYRAQLSPAEQRMLHDFKKRFGGTTTWKEHGTQHERD